MNTRRIFLSAFAFIYSLATYSIVYPTSSYEIDHVNGGQIIKWLGPETEIDLTSDPNLRDLSRIGSQAFKDNTTLKSIKLSSSLVAIYDRAFQNCSALESVEFSLTGQENEMWYPLNDMMFVNCPNLKTVTISKYVIGVAGEAFEGCTSLTTFKINGSHPTLRAYDGVLYNNDYTELVLFPCGRTGHYDVHEKTQTIGEEAFRYSSLTSVYLDGNVTSIQPYAFYKAASLTTVNLPVSLRSIGKAAFVRCEKLKTLIFQNSLEEIGGWAFFGCKSLPETLNLPSSLYSIAGDAFARTSVKNYKFPNGNYNFSIVDGVLYDSYQTKVVSYPGGREDTEYNIPYGVSAVGTYAFCEATIEKINMPPSLQVIEESAFEASNLKSVSIPEGVVSVGRTAFGLCPNLVEIELPSTLSSFDEYSFWKDDPATPRTVICHSLSPNGKWKSGDVKYDKLYVPEEVIDIYKMAKYWRDFGEILPIPVIQNYAVTYDTPDYGLLIVAADGDEIESGAEVAEGSSISVLAIPFAGYQVRNVMVNGKEMENNTSFSITDNTHIIANFVSNQELGVNSVSAYNEFDASYTASGIKNSKNGSKVYLVRMKNGQIRKIILK